MEPRSLDTRKRLVQTALELFATRGYHNTGIAEILKESGVNRGALYHHFSCKKELGLATIDEMARILSEETGVRDLLQTSNHPIDAMLRIVDDLPGTMKLQSGEPLTPSLVVRLGSAEAEFSETLSARFSQIIADLESIVRRGVAEGLISDGVEPRLITSVFTVICEGVFLMSVLGQRQEIWEEARGWLRDYLTSLRR
jgi:AcrR family transcriptional regulator